MTHQTTDDVEARGPIQETDEHKYARHTRNATVFIAIVIAAQIVVALAVGIFIAVTLSSAVSTTTNFGSNSTSCDITNPDWPNC